MDYSDLSGDEPRRKTPVERLLALFEVFLLSGLVSSALAFLPLFILHGNKVDLLASDTKIVSAFLLLESAITFILLALILGIHGGKIRDLGLHWDGWKTDLSIGLALVPILFLTSAAVTSIFRIYLPQYYIEQNPLTENIKTPLQLVLFIFSALVAGGVKEELQRAFILRKFSRYLGGAGLGLVLWSLAFGAGHSAQKGPGIAAAVIYGLAFGIIYLIRGSLIAPIVAHGMYDTLALLLYWFSSGRFK
jgi:membrane protease YdiL (CAAX protease family)